MTCERMCFRPADTVHRRFFLQKEEEETASSATTDQMSWCDRKDRNVSKPNSPQG